MECQKKKCLFNCRLILGFSFQLTALIFVPFIPICLIMSRRKKINNNNSNYVSIWIFLYVQFLLGSFFYYNKEKKYVNWTCFDMVITLEYLLDNSFCCNRDSRYRNVIESPIGAYWYTLLITFLYCNEQQCLYKINNG